MKYIIISLLLLATSCLDKPFHEEKPEVEFIYSFPYWLYPPGLRPKPLLSGSFAWHQIKEVLYKDKLITVTKNKVIIKDRFTFEIDPILNSKINDFKGNLLPYLTQVFNDTLYSHKGNSLCYWSDVSEKWVDAERTPDYFYFGDFLYSDSSYTFSFRDQGEWGSFLFIRNRNNGKIHCFSVRRSVIQVFKMEGLYHLLQSEDFFSQRIGTTRISKIPDIEKIPLLTNYDIDLQREAVKSVSLINKGIIEVVKDKSLSYGIFNTGKKTFTLDALTDSFPRNHTCRQVYLFDENGERIRHRNHEEAMWIGLYSPDYVQEYTDYFIIKFNYENKDGFLGSACFLKINKIKSE